MDHFRGLYFVFVMLSCLFIAVFLSPAWKRLNSLLSYKYVTFYCVFVTFPCDVLGQLWCLIV